MTEGDVIDLTDGQIEWNPQRYETQDNLELWDNNISNFFNFNIRVARMTEELITTDPKINKIRSIGPNTDISTPKKVSKTEMGHEWNFKNGMISTVGGNICQEYGCTLKYLEKDQWNFSHLWKCPYNIILKKGNYVIKMIGIIIWANLYPEAEEMISCRYCKFKEEWVQVSPLINPTENLQKVQ